MGRGAALIPTPPPPVARSTPTQIDPLLASLVTRITALEKRPSGGITKSEATTIFDAVHEAMTKREAKLRKELTDLHTNALADIRTAAGKLEAMSTVSFDASVALVRQSINRFVGE